LMNCLLAPELMRALTDIRVLLSTVLSCNEISVSLRRSGQKVMSGFILFKVISSNLSFCHLVSSGWDLLLVQNSAWGCSLLGAVGTPQIDL